jgi:hypothetical protein
MDYTSLVEPHILRLNLRMAKEQRHDAEPVFTRIRPNKRLSCQLIGKNITELTRNPESGQIPILSYPKESVDWISS